MKRLPFLGAALALACAACGGQVQNDESTSASSGGAGGPATGGGASCTGEGGASPTGGDASSTGEGGVSSTGTGGVPSSTTTSTDTTTSTEDSGPCVEDAPFAPQCSNSAVVLTKCGCAEEALALLPMIAAAAKAAHEASGALCGSALPVPVVTPAGTYYMPCTGPGTDFQTGDSENGWVCLQVELPGPLHCRYAYTKGASPVTAASGGPDVVSTPESFEVSAEGDDDGDSITSAFAITGELQADGTMAIHPMFVHQPDE